MSKLSILKEFIVFLMQNKRWWLTPIIAMFIVLGALILFTANPAVAPYIYSLF